MFHRTQVSLSIKGNFFLRNCLKTELLLQAALAIPPQLPSSCTSKGSTRIFILKKIPKGICSFHKDMKQMTAIKSTTEELFIPDSGGVNSSLGWISVCVIPKCSSPHGSEQHELWKKPLRKLTIAVCKLLCLEAVVLLSAVVCWVDVSLGWWAGPPTYFAFQTVKQQTTLSHQTQGTKFSCLFWWMSYSEAVSSCFLAFRNW